MVISAWPQNTYGGRCHKSFDSDLRTLPYIHIPVKAYFNVLQLTNSVTLPPQDRLVVVFRFYT